MTNNNYRLVRESVCYRAIALFTKAMFSSFSFGILKHAATAGAAAFKRAFTFSGSRKFFDDVFADCRKDFYLLAQLTLGVIISLHLIMDVQMRHRVYFLSVIMLLILMSVLYCVKKGLLGRIVTAVKGSVTFRILNIKI